MSLTHLLRAALAAVALATATLAPMTFSTSALAQTASAPAAEASAAPVMPAVTTAPTVVKESVENPYGLEAMWKEGDFVTDRKSTRLNSSHG